MPLVNVIVIEQHHFLYILTSPFHHVDRYFASSTVGTQPTVVVNPFATRFAFDGSSAVTSTQLGISSLQVSHMFQTVAYKIECSQEYEFACLLNLETFNW